MKSVIIGGCVAAVLLLSGMYTYNAAYHVYHLTEPSAEAVDLPLERSKVDSSWIKSGTPKFHTSVYVQKGNTTSGIWTCEGPTTFEWTFNQDEQVYILEGKVDVTYMGNQFTLEPGQTATFLAGTKAVWHVPGYLKKSFTLHRPNLMVLAYRKIFGVV